MEGVLVEGCMGSGRPQPARAVAVTVTRSLDHNNPIPFREPVHETVHGEVLDQGAVAVNEGQRLALTALHVVQAHAIHVQEAADRGGWRSASRVSLAV